MTDEQIITSFANLIASIDTMTHMIQVLFERIARLEHKIEVLENA